MVCAALLLVVLACVTLPALLATSGNSNVMTSEDVDLDEESDPAAFMIVVEHGDEWRCSGSLLSQRTAVTTARCALGREVRDDRARELLAFASSLMAARPPAPLSEAARRVRRVALATASAAPVALVLAVLELERPFGAAAVAIPIQLATSRGECERARLCNSVRALTARRRRRVLLRVADLALTEDARCAGRVPQWPTPPRGVVCYAGDELCENDLGGGVVCGGKLCAVLGDTAASGSAGGSTSGSTVRCSNTYAALDVTYWRHFLHCAHTLRMCGRYYTLTLSQNFEDCAGVCSEQLFIRDSGATNDNDTQDNEVSVTSWNELNVAVTRSSSGTALTSIATRTRTHERTRAPSAAAVDYTSFPAAVGRSVVFEPNRADFKVTPSRTTLVRLKAGEYGDNAAEYESDEQPLPPTRTSTASTPASVPARPNEKHERESPAIERRVSPTARSAVTSNNTWRKHIIIVLLLFVL